MCVGIDSNTLKEYRLYEKGTIRIIYEKSGQIETNEMKIRYPFIFIDSQTIRYFPNFGTFVDWTIRPDQNESICMFWSTDSQFSILTKKEYQSLIDFKKFL